MKQVFDYAERTLRMAPLIKELFDEKEVETIPGDSIGLIKALKSKIRTLEESTEALENDVEKLTEKNLILQSVVETYNEALFDEDGSSLDDLEKFDPKEVK